MTCLHRMMKKKKVNDNTQLMNNRDPYKKKLLKYNTYSFAYLVRLDMHIILTNTHIPVIQFTL